MTVTEKIEAYIDGRIASGELIPGGRLPSYSEMQKRFGITYASAQRAYKNLEVAGKIKVVNGIGSFLNGGDILDVDFYVTATSFDFAELQKILDDISIRNNLNLNIHLLDRAKHKSYDFCGNEHKIVIMEHDPWVHILGTLMDFSAFDGYAELISEFQLPNKEANNLYLPFFMIGFQGAVNPILLRKIGFSKTIDSFSTFDWWDELTALCKAHNTFPAIKNFSKTGIVSFIPQTLLEILMANKLGRIDHLFDLPFFETQEGERLFRMLKDYGTAWDGTPSFRQGGCVLEISQGSWITAQWKKNPDMIGDSFRIIPTKCREKRMLRYGIMYLETFVNRSIAEHEKKRVWCLLRELLSKDAQKRLMGHSGMISLRKDMRPSDHTWAEREDYLAFFPENNDLLLHTGTLSTEVISALDTLYEQYEFCGADSANIRKYMDRKLAANNK